MDDAKSMTPAGEGVPLPAPSYRDRVQQLIRASVAPETRRAYASRLRHFSAWCEAEGIAPPLPAPPEIVAAYVAHLAEAGAADAAPFVRSSGTGSVPSWRSGRGRGP